MGAQALADLTDCSDHRHCSGSDHPIMETKWKSDFQRKPKFTEGRRIDTLLELFR
jgi:hypothetical protein